MTPISLLLLLHALDILLAFCVIFASGGNSAVSSADFAAYDADSAASNAGSELPHIPQATTTELHETGEYRICHKLPRLSSMRHGSH